MPSRGADHAHGAVRIEARDRIGVTGDELPVAVLAAEGARDAQIEADHVVSSGDLRLPPLELDEITTLLPGGGRTPYAHARDGTGALDDAPVVSIESSDMIARRLLATRAPPNDLWTD